MVQITFSLFLPYYCEIAGLVSIFLIVHPAFLEENSNVPADGRLLQVREKPKGAVTLPTVFFMDN